MQRDYSVDAAAVALTATTAKTVLAIKTGTADPVDIITIAFGCDATATGLLKVELITFTSANDGTGTTYTPKAFNGDSALVAAATTAKTSYTVEPTSPTVIRTWISPLPIGPFELLYPLGREYTVPISTGCGLRFTSTTVSPNAYGALVFEE